MPPQSPETSRGDVACWQSPAATTLAVLIVLAGLGWARWQGPSMARPLGFDEFLTLEYYTWAGVAPSGEAKALRRVDDYRGQQPPGIRQFVVGIFRSLGTWKEPNNHVLNSALIDLALAAGHVDESTARLPALVGAMFFAGSLYWLCGPKLGWTQAAPLLAAWAFCNPYVVIWSQTARGYSWTLALQALLLLSLCRLASRPSSIRRGVVCAALAILTFVNVVNLAVDWLLPVYAAFWFLPPRVDGRGDPQSGDAATWRRNLLVQGLCILAVGGVFLIDRLPYVYSSARQYGVPLGSSYNLSDGSVDIARELFPGPVWGAFGVFGLLGTGMMAASRLRRSPVSGTRSPQREAATATLGGATLATLGVGLAHFGLSSRIPYPRTCGYFVPLILLGAAYLVERAVRSVQPRWARTLVWLTAAIATVGLSVVALHTRPPTELDVDALRSVSAQVDHPAVCVMLPPDIDYLLGKYLPRHWSDTSEVTGDSEFELGLLERCNDGWKVEMLEGASEGRRWRTIDGIEDEAAIRGPYRLRVLRVASRPLTAEAASRGCLPAVVIWRPDPARLGLDANELMTHIGRSAVPYIRRNARVFTKLDFNGQLRSLEFVACTTTELETIAELVEEELSRFGGSALILEPVRSPRPPSSSKPESSTEQEAARTRRS